MAYTFRGAQPETPESGEPDLQARQLGPYWLLEVLGRGGMGEVYLARHCHLECPVAIKIIASRWTENQQVVARFRQEMRAVGRLKHPNIVQATDAGEADGRYFLVMEHVDGIDLQTLLKQRGPLSVREALGLIRQAAQALQYASAHGLIHRDIKPSNLMLQTDGTLKVLDFGLAKVLTPEAEQPQDSSTDRTPTPPVTNALQVLGTPDYMAPEQAWGQAAIDIRADIYSLGCTLYTLLAQRGPFEDAEHSSTQAKLRAHQIEDPVPIRVFRPDVSPAVDAILTRMLAKQAGDRFENPQSLIQALDELPANTAGRLDLPQPAAEWVGGIPSQRAAKPGAGQNPPANNALPNNRPGKHKPDGHQGTQPDQRAFGVEPSSNSSGDSSRSDSQISIRNVTAAVGVVALAVLLVSLMTMTLMIGWPFGLHDGPPEITQPRPWRRKPQTHPLPPRIPPMGMGLEVVLGEPKNPHLAQFCLWEVPASGQKLMVNIEGRAVFKFLPPRWDEENYSLSAELWSHNGTLEGVALAFGGRDQAQRTDFQIFELLPKEKTGEFIIARQTMTILPSRFPGRVRTTSNHLSTWNSGQVPNAGAKVPSQKIVRFAMTVRNRQLTSVTLEDTEVLPQLNLIRSNDRRKTYRDTAGWAGLAIIDKWVTVRDIRINGKRVTLQPTAGRVPLRQAIPGGTQRLTLSDRPASGLSPAGHSAAGPLLPGRLP